ncbi:Flowering time control protein FCA [Camellia lanceoleosa]|uniref:Flowering time control protein FCA n=1 Tax=Camellia lanceoleosa TaxID=1840588 RepID=A0ACC0FMW4_9ERIC|nr:Flowering time control protein FCA [Camellia lanceoleosa]
MKSGYKLFTSAGCCFVKYTTCEEADRAMSALHNQHTLPGGVGPIQGDGFCTPEGQSEPPVAMGNISSQGVYTPQGQSRPPFAMGPKYVEGHGRAIYISQSQSQSQSRPESQSQPSFAMGLNYVEGHGRAIYISQSQSQSRPESQSQPSFAMGRTSIHHVMYPTYDIQLSQASHSPADSHVDGHPWKGCTER